MLISVIIPAYNEEVNLELCVTSVLAALDFDFEILIVDDGSTDNTVAVARRLEKQHPSVHLLQHPGNVNRGVAATRNLGLEHATGDYVAFIDADDLCQPTRFVSSIKILQHRHDIDGVLVSVCVIFDEGADEAVRAHFPQVLDHEAGILPDDYACATLHGRSKFHISNVVFRKTLLSKSGYFDIHKKLSAEDTDLWLRMALCGRFCLAEEQKPQIYYRRHRGNSWTPNRNDYFRDLEILSGVLKWARKSPWVVRPKIDMLEQAFEDKLFYCFSLARSEKLPTNGIYAAWLAGINLPKFLMQRRYWSNAIRVVFFWFE